MQQRSHCADSMRYGYVLKNVYAFAHRFGFVSYRIRANLRFGSESFLTGDCLERVCSLLENRIFCKAFAHYCLSKGSHQIRLSKSFEIVVVWGGKQRKNFQNFTVIFNTFYLTIEFIFASDHHFENIEPYTSCFIIHNKKKAIIINIIDYTISSNPASFF